MAKNETKQENFFSLKQLCKNNKKQQNNMKTDGTTYNFRFNDKLRK